MTHRDYDYDGNLRTVLVEFDGDVPKNTGLYLVQGWVYRLGWEDIRRFPTEADASGYAMRKAHKHKRRYRVMGPIIEEEE